jgi:hypothetical protein
LDIALTVRSVGLAQLSNAEVLHAHSHISNLHRHNASKTRP